MSTILRSSQRLFSRARMSRPLPKSRRNSSFASEYETHSKKQKQNHDFDDEKDLDLDMNLDSSGPSPASLRPSSTQLKLGESVRRVLQRAVLTGQFSGVGEGLDLRTVGFDVDDVHFSKDLARATVFWSIISGQLQEVQRIVQGSVKQWTYHNSL